MNGIDSDTQEYLTEVVKSFSPGIHYAFAYGSGVFKQQGHASLKDNMIDFIFVVSDSYSWHKQNLEKFAEHYSFLKRCGPGMISKVQRNYGAKIYFNTLVDFNNRLIKYGVIDFDNFIKDMHTWETLYVSGRLHKPVVCIKGLDDTLISSSVIRNLTSAVESSLLTLPEQFSEEELYLCITGLSYSGDIRMVIGEDKGKIRNIVSPNLVKFRNLYSDIINKSRALHSHNGYIKQDISPEVQGDYIKRLPATLQNNIFRQFCVSSTNLLPENMDTTMLKLAADREKCKKATLGGLHHIIRKSSMTQTIKGIATSGLNKSVFYSFQKLKKMFKSLK